MDNTEGPYNILLIEDSGTDAYMIKRILKKHLRPSCHVQHAENMAQAETILNDHTDIEAILLDLHLPDTNSERETLGRLEELRQTLPVIILTGMNDYAFAVKMVKATAAEFVDKALISTNPEIICDIVRFTVEQYRARQATDLSSTITEAG